MKQLKELQEVVRLLILCYYQQNMGRQTWLENAEFYDRQWLPDDRKHGSEDHDQRDNIVIKVKEVSDLYTHNYTLCSKKGINKLENMETGKLDVILSMLIHTCYSWESLYFMRLIKRYF